MPSTMARSGSIRCRRTAGPAHGVVRSGQRVVSAFRGGNLYRESMTSTGIDRSSPIPFYHQLKVLLLARIAAEKLVAGDRLPSDHQLCDQFDVSRTVVRQALADLEHEGVIVREKGRGTFVAQSKSTQGLVQSLTGLYEDAARSGRALRSEVRRLETVPADDVVARSLAVEPGSPVVLLDRLRYIDEVPWVSVTTYLPADLGVDLTAAELVDGSLYEILGRQGLRPVRGTRSIEARVATGPQAKALQIARGSALLFLSSIGYDATGRPVELFEAFHRGDRTRFEVSLPLSGADVRDPGLVVLP